MNNLDLGKFISACKEVEQIRAKHAGLRIGSKQDFNFFYALVEKTHLEKYHSNFLAYLLNPKESHGFEDLFLKSFLELILTNYKSEPAEEERFSVGVNKITVTKEAPLGGGRVDILITSENPSWAIFIENKIRSKEQPKQVIDYYEDIKKRKYSNYLGIYLTPNGDSAPSIENLPEAQNVIINLSYKEAIIKWLEACLQNKELILYPFVVGSLVQYLNILKIELGIMGNKENMEQVETLLKNKDLVFLAQNINDLDSAIQGAIKRIRDEFLDILKKEIVETLKEKLTSEIDFKEKHLKLSNNKEEFYLCVDQAFPDYAEDEDKDNGKGLWWGLFKDNQGTPFGDIHLEYKHWEGLKIKGNNDYSKDKDGFKIIFESDKKELAKELAKGIADTLLKKFTNTPS